MMAEASRNRALVAPSSTPKLPCRRPTAANLPALQTRSRRAVDATAHPSGCPRAPTLAPPRVHTHRTHVGARGRWPPR